ncbi:MAG: DeoR/GlpR transcriptional regulator [Spirochaetes bacterium]|nr:DeoR/GlpR transcriptional regulator [Spirochaetota bacterium]
MIPAERYELILNAVKRKQFIGIDELCYITKSSRTTLRRDINYLTEAGKIKKITGGISIVETDDKKLPEFPYDRRMNINKQEKVAIGKAAQQLIEDGDVILILNGTTTFQVAHEIDPPKHLTIITNGIDIVSALSVKPNVEVILLGGLVKYNHSMTIGPSLYNMFNELHPSKFITGAGGVTEEKGITMYDYIGANYVGKITDMIEGLILVADHSKFGRNVLVQAFPFNSIRKVVTDEKVPQEYASLFKKYEIECFIA